MWPRIECQRKIRQISFLFQHIKRTLKLPLPSLYQDEPEQTKTRTTILPNSPAPGHITERKHGPKVSMHPNIYCNTVYNSQDMEKPKLINRGIDKEDVVHIFNGTLHSHQKRMK